MSILIKGMEMPTNCESCPCKTADAFGGLGCRATGYIPLREANQSRPEWCPLVPVPPHGRLIDADAFLALVNDSTILSDFLKCIISPLIRGEPTVIEAEEVNK